MADKLRQIEKFVEIVDSLVQHQFGSGRCRKTGDDGGVIGVQPGEDTAALGGKPLRVVDMGSGLGYLTFAVHAHLRRKFGPGVVTVGVEQRAELVCRTAQVARELGEEFEGLSFVQASLAEYIARAPGVDSEGGASGTKCRNEGIPGIALHEKEEGIQGKLHLQRLLQMAEVVSKKDASTQSLHAGVDTQGNAKDCSAGAAKVDVLIALHACDTATDEAIWYGIQAGAEVIIVAPCCQKEVRRQMEKSARGVQLQPDAVTDTDEPTSSLANPLRACLEYGTYRERVAEMVTDTLRALYLQYAGYDVKVFEFVSGEHTPKNILITATKRSAAITGKRRTELRGKIAELKDTWRVAEHRLGSLMGL
jgi:hypothetical protein